MTHGRHGPLCREGNVSPSDHHLVTNPSDLSILWRDSWEGKTVPEGLSQPDPCRPMPAELGTQHQLPLPAGVRRCGPAQEAPAGGPPHGGSVPHCTRWRDLYHTQGYPAAPYPLTSFMTMSSDPPPKVGPFSPDEGGRHLCPPGRFSMDQR